VVAFLGIQFMNYAVGAKNVKNQLGKKGSTLSPRLEMSI